MPVLGRPAKRLMLGNGLIFAKTQQSVVFPPARVQLHWHSFSTSPSYETCMEALESLSTATEVPDAARRAEDWLKALEGTPHITADAYVPVVQAWANSTAEDFRIAKVRAERWIYKHWESDREHLRPNTASLNALLDVYSRGRAQRQRDLIEAAELATNLLQHMMNQRYEHGEFCRISPNIDTFNFVIRAWTRCRENPELSNRAKGVFQLLEKYGREEDPSVQPNEKTYNMILDSMAVSARLKSRRKGTETGLDEIRNIEERLRTMPTQFRSTNSRNMLLAAWANIALPKSPFECERLFETIEEPNEYTYLNVMRSWLLSKHPDRASKVAQWLNRQRMAAKTDPTLLPRLGAYHLVMRAWTDVGQPEQTQNVLNHLVLESQTNEALQPTSESFTLLIRAWLVLDRDEAALEMAVQIFTWLVGQESADESLVVPFRLYQLVLLACIKCGTPKAVGWARQIVDLVIASHRDVLPHHYTSLLKAGLSGLRGRKRARFVYETVRECQEAGLLSQSMVTVLVESGLQGDLLDEDPFPRSWSRNVPYDALLPRHNALQWAELSVTKRHAAWQARRESWSSRSKERY